MRFIKSSALALSLCAALGASPVYAGEKDTARSCVAAGSEVSSTLSSASQNTDAARHEKSLGTQACNAGFYEQGMSHYAKAMELLGAKLARS